MSVEAFRAWIDDQSSGWRREFARRVFTGEDASKAFEEILIRGLRQGDARPLVDAIENNIPLPLAVQRYVGALLDGGRATILTTLPVTHEIRFDDGRGRGRYPCTSADRLKKTCAAIFGAVDRLERELPVDSETWALLAICLRCGTPRDFAYRPGWMDIVAPARLVRLRRQKGRPPDLEAPERDRVLKEMVEARRAQGLTYRAAVPAVQQDIERQWASEGAKHAGGLAPKSTTIREAAKKF